MGRLKVILKPNDGLSGQKFQAYWFAQLVVSAVTMDSHLFE